MKKFVWAMGILAAGCAASSVRQPSGARGAEWRDRESMDMAQLRERAFARCQKPFHRPKPEPVPLLDPPQIYGSDAEGMIFQEELAVRTTNLLDRDEFYFSPRPRAAVNTLPMEIFVGENGNYRRKTWEDANPDYSSPEIRPAIKRDDIPPAGRVLTELIIGHRSPSGDWPQLFDIRSSAYVRFAGYPPQITGASLRLATHGVFDAKNGEDFPIVRAMFASVKKPGTANALLLVESELFCGALDMDMNEGLNADIVVDGYWYTRRDFDWRRERHTGLVAYSSMTWKNENHTPERSTDEAHDTDTFRVQFADGRQVKKGVQSPGEKLKVTDYTGRAVKEWVLANEDRDPAHYADFAPALGHTNYDKRASYKVEILDSNIKTGVSLYESKPDGEYGDNIVAMSTIRENIPKATSPAQYVRFKYRTTAYFPE